MFSCLYSYSKHFGETKNCYNSDLLQKVGSCFKRKACSKLVGFYADCVILGWNFQNASSFVNSPINTRKSMKACLMRVNYDPKYLNPNGSNNNGNNVNTRSTASFSSNTAVGKSLENLQTRFKVCFLVILMSKCINMLMMPISTLPFASLLHTRAPVIIFYWACVIFPPSLSKLFTLYDHEAVCRFFCYSLEVNILTDTLDTFLLVVN